MRNVIIFSALLWMFGCKRDADDVAAHERKSNPVLVVQDQFYGPEAPGATVKCLWLGEGVWKCSSTDRRMFTCSNTDMGCNTNTNCIEEFAEFQRGR